VVGSCELGKEAMKYKISSSKIPKKQLSHHTLLLVRLPGVGVSVSVCACSCHAHSSCCIAPNKDSIDGRGELTKKLYMCCEFPLGLNLDTCSPKLCEALDVPQQIK
jgi:hypothetical protein